MHATVATAAPTLAWPRPRALLRQPLAWVSLLGFLAYLGPAASVLQLGPDQVEYIDIARRLVAGEGYRLGVKGFHFGGTEVLHNGLAERAPLFPWLIAALLKLGLGLYAVQVVNAALTAASAGLVGAIGGHLFGERVGMLAAVLALACPVVVERMVTPMAEPITIALVLLATWLVARSLERPRPALFFLAGGALGLGYLARPTVAALAAALVLGAWVAARDRRAILAPLAALALGMALFVVPITGYSLATQGSLSYSGQSYLYAVARDSDVLHDGYTRPVPTPREFIAANPGFVISGIATMAWYYVTWVLTEPRMLLAFLPAWPVVLWGLWRRRYPRAAWVPLLVAAANYATYAVTWSSSADRYMLVTLLLLLPFGVDGLARLGLGRLALPLRPARGWRVGALEAWALAVVLFWSPTLLGQYAGRYSDAYRPVGTREDAGLRWTGTREWVEDESLVPMTEWLLASTDRDDVVAHAEPWVWTFFTGRPSTLLPHRLSEEQLRRFIAEYRVAYLLFDPRDRPRRAYRGYLEALADRGVRATTVGEYRVFDTRALWQ